MEGEEGRRTGPAVAGAGEASQKVDASSQDPFAFCDPILARYEGAPPFFFPRRNVFCPLSPSGRTDGRASTEAKCFKGCKWKEYVILLESHAVCIPLLSGPRINIVPPQIVRRKS